MYLSPQQPLRLQNLFGASPAGSQVSSDIGQEGRPREGLGRGAAAVAGALSGLWSGHGPERSAASGPPPEATPLETFGRALSSAGLAGTLSGLWAGGEALPQGSPEAPACPQIFPAPPEALPTEPPSPSPAAGAAEAVVRTHDPVEGDILQWFLEAPRPRVMAQEDQDHWDLSDADVEEEDAEADTHPLPSEPFFPVEAAAATVVTDKECLLCDTDGDPSEDASADVEHLRSLQEAAQLESLDRARRARALYLRAQLGDHLRAQTQQACEEVDRLVSSALRALPADLKAMPARQALSLLAAAADAPPPPAGPVRLQARAEAAHAVLRGHLRAQEAQACQEVDRLVAIALAGLPLAVRQLPARQALRLLAGSSSESLSLMEAVSLIASTMEQMQAMDRASLEALARQHVEAQENLKKSAQLNQELSETLRNLDKLSAEERLGRQRRYKMHFEELVRGSTCGLASPPCASPISAVRGGA